MDKLTRELPWIIGSLGFLILAAILVFVAASRGPVSDPETRHRAIVEDVGEIRSRNIPVKSND